MAEFYSSVMWWHFGFGVSKVVSHIFSYSLTSLKEAFFGFLFYRYGNNDLEKSPACSWWGQSRSRVSDSVSHAHVIPIKLTLKEKRVLWSQGDIKLVWVKHVYFKQLSFFLQKWLRCWLSKILATYGGERMRFRADLFSIRKHWLQHILYHTSV